MKVGEGELPEVAARNQHEEEEEDVEEEVGDDMEGVVAAPLARCTSPEVGTYNPDTVASPMAKENPSAGQLA